jgi:hypothetical protein
MDRERLARLLGMLGSVHAGEIVNAARLAVRLVKDSELTWEQVVNSDMNGVAVQAPQQLLVENDQLRADNEELLEQLRRLRTRMPSIPSSWGEPVTAAEKIEHALQWTAVLNDWEREFVTGIAGRCRLSERQQASLDRIAGKIALIARARGMAP